MPETNGSTNKRGKEPIDRFEEVVANALLARKEFFQRFLDPRRSIDDECGYPHSVIDSWFYQDLYDREAIAERVVKVLPRETWQVQPMVYEVETVDTHTSFEIKWEGLGRTLRGQPSYHQDVEGGVVSEYLQRLDEQSGIGQYGVLLLGLDDGLPLSEPAIPRPDANLLFLRVLPEVLAPIAQFDQDVSSPRFGQPLSYNLTLNDPRNVSGVTGYGYSTSTQQVHWTRILHVADNLGSSEVFGVPRMRPVLNRLLDLRKLYSGSAEMYWRGAFPGISVETHPTTGGDVEINRQGLRDELENYMNGLQRYMALMGMSAKSLAPQVVDPTPQIHTQIEAICIQLGMPIRIFKGSERGELASTQDDAAWNERIKFRQRMHVTPRIIVPFVDRMIWLGALPQPSGYSVYWPDMTAQTEAEKATVALQKTQAMATYVGSNVEELMPPLDYLTRVMSIPEREAVSVLESALALAKERQAQAEALSEGIDPGIGDTPVPTDRKGFDPAVTVP